VQVIAFMVEGTGKHDIDDISMSRGMVPFSMCCWLCWCASDWVREALVAGLEWTCKRVVDRGGRRQWLGELLLVFLPAGVVGHGRRQRQSIECCVDWLL
jgi:hypothetical protein